MDVHAVIIANDLSDDDAELPRGLLVSGGLSLLERQLRQLHQLGVSKVRILSHRFPEALQNALAKMSCLPKSVEVIDANFATDAGWEDEASVLLVEDGVLVDARLMKAVLENSSDQALAFFPAKAVVYGLGDGLSLEFGGQSRLFASVAKTNGKSIRRAFGEETFSASPLRTVLELIDGLGATLVGTDELDTYMPNLRRTQEILWRPITRRSECRRAEDVLIGRTQKSVLDWPAEWIHPVFENFAVRILLSTFVTPNMVSIVTGIFGFWITWLFWQGQFGLGLAGAMIVGVLDGIDGKLARVKLLQSRVGEAEHVLDKLVEYSWYLAIAGALAAQTGETAIWALAIIIIGFTFAEAFLGELYRRMSMRQLDDAGSFERRFRVIGARRNTIIWALVPFVLEGSLILGFWVMALYAFATFWVVMIRFAIRTRNFTTQSSAIIARNFDLTRY